MVETVDVCIMEVVQAATGVNFESEKMAKERLRLPARMKGGVIKRATDKRYPAFFTRLTGTFSYRLTIGLRGIKRGFIFSNT